uniref:Thioredoxin-disulfide reductase n=3 Tax=Opuntia streptacantha TaxID=393608 RepID=A0A7C9DZG8_OPUST
MEEANFLTKFGSKVCIIHRRDKFKASKIMQKRVLENPKIEVIWNSVVLEAYGDEEKGGKVLGGVKVKNVVTGEISDLKVSGLFFAIGHEPATKFLGGQLELDSDGYVVTKPGLGIRVGAEAEGDGEEIEQGSGVLGPSNELKK